MKGRTLTYPLRRVELRPGTLRLIERDIMALPDHEYLVTVQKLEEAITDPQRALWWTWMTIMGEDLGYTRREMNDVLLSMVGGPVSITELSKDDFSYILTAVYDACTEQGYHLPTSMDYYWAAMEADLAKSPRAGRG